MRIEELYAFHYTPKDIDSSQEAGWNLYDPLTEFQRMEVPKSLWAPSSLNEKYEVWYNYTVT